MVQMTENKKLLCKLINRSVPIGLRNCPKLRKVSSDMWTNELQQQMDRLDYHHDCSGNPEQFLNTLQLSSHLSSLNTSNQVSKIYLLRKKRETAKSRKLVETENAHFPLFSVARDNISGPLLLLKSIKSYFKLYFGTQAQEGWLSLKDTRCC